MAFKDRFRRAVSARKDSISSSSSPSPSSPPSSGYTTPALSRTASTVQLPALISSPTRQTDKSLKLTKSTSSGFSLSRFRSSSSNKSEFERHAPKNYKFRVADPLKVATLNSWDWNYGATRGSVSSQCGGVCPLTP